MTFIDETPSDFDRDPHSSHSSRSPLLSYVNRLFVKRRALVTVFIGFFLLAFITSFLATYFMLKKKQFRVFKSKVITIIEKDYPTLDAATRLAYVDELVTIHNTGKISNDAAIELDAFVKFKEFNEKYKRTHRDFGHILSKFLVFRTNIFHINDHPEKESYTLGINKFADMSEDEFFDLHPPIRPPKYSTPVSKHMAAIRRYFENSTYISKLKKAKNIDYDIDISSVRGEDIDWRRAEAVSDVKDQGEYCGSCWAFSAIASVESAYKLFKNKTYSLSEQELINCDKYSEGCAGGLTHTALEYIHSKGVSQSKDTPYHGLNEKCHVYPGNRLYIDSISIAKGLDIINRSLVLSPTVVAIAADPEMRFYSGGIYTGQCGETLNHAVLLVGEGYDPYTEKRFWIIKNSWGKQWGEDGYMRLERTNERDGKCKILTFGINPILH